MSHIVLRCVNFDQSDFDEHSWKTFDKREIKKISLLIGRSFHFLTNRQFSEMYIRPKDSSFMETLKKFMLIKMQQAIYRAITDGDLL